MEYGSSRPSLDRGASHSGELDNQRQDAIASSAGFPMRVGVDRKNVYQNRANKMCSLQGITGYKIQTRSRPVFDQSIDPFPGIGVMPGA